MSSGGGRTGARVAVKMEVAPYYGEEGLELLPDFVQLPGFGGGPGTGGPTGLEPPEESGAVQQRKLLLVGKPPPPRDLGAASPGNPTLPPAGPFLRPRGGTSNAVHRLIQETTVGAGPEVGPAVLQPLLKLPAAADLEQLLIQAGSPGLAGPSSPTGGGPSVATAGGAPFLYRSPQSSAPPQAVTQEQEGFADGFVKALADLHKQNQLLGVSPAPLSPTQHPGGPCCPTSRQDPPAVYTTLGNFNPASPSAGGAFFTPQPVARLPAAGTTGRALEEPQTVPEAPVIVSAPPLPLPPPPPPPPHPPSGLSSGESPPPPSSLSPLDAESQERLKAERKRLRNRIAASKCRRRKLERIARLEEKVKALKGQNAELAATASLLRAQVTQLQGRVRSHLSSGCHINANAPAPAQTLAVGGQPPGREAPTEPETSAC
ncbi:transcription factor JunD-like [Ahaetulla prasina]|uniref:transcription factor JunD-like n=1 Tax=Ahaetulla prasina TaxID=499056 RepID=UPI002649F85D|nr:transcription factor JunD-like [Ahaetulla prasina]